MSTVGAVDSHCIVNVPNGASVDASNDDLVTVTLNGEVTTYTPCGKASAPNFDDLAGVSRSDGGKNRGVGGAGTSQWYDYSWSNAIPSGGLQQFDYAAAIFSVPAPGPLDSTVLYLFPSLQNVTGNPTNCPNGSGCGTVQSIIQPILQWGYNTYNGGHYWQAEPMAVSNMVYVGPPCVGVSTGDTILGLMRQSASNQWEIAAYDETNGCFSYYYYTVPASQPPFNTYQGGVLEGYGSQFEAEFGTNPIPSCFDLPAGGSESFSTLGLEEAGPSWNSYNVVTNQTSWQSFYDCGPGTLCWSPTRCGWSSSASNNFGGGPDPVTQLNW